jgi:hypothetical protein
MEMAASHIVSAARHDSAGLLSVEVGEGRDPASAEQTDRQTREREGERDIPTDRRTDGLTRSGSESRPRAARRARCSRWAAPPR